MRWVGVLEYPIGERGFLERKVLGNCTKIGALSEGVFLLKNFYNISLKKYEYLNKINFCFMIIFLRALNFVLFSYYPLNANVRIFEFV